MKKLSLILVLSLLLGIAASLAFHRYVDPSGVFFLRAAEISDEWAAELRKSDEPCYVFAGGSDTRTGIDPAVMLNELNLRAINTALAADYGLRCNIANAQTYLRAGDTLVIGLTCFTDSYVSPTSIGLKMLFNRRGFHMFQDGIVPLTRKNLSLLALGRSYNVCAYVMKRCFSAGPLYKYDVNTVVHPSGWMDVRYREIDKYELGNTRVQPVHSDSELFRFLSFLRKWCEEHQVRLAVYASPHYVHESQRITHALHYLAFTRMGIPVVRDTRLGVVTDKNAYSDFTGHLGGEAVAENSRIIARALRDNSYWTEEELTEYLHQHGWNDDGTPLEEREACVHPSDAAPVPL